MITPPNSGTGPISFGTPVHTRSSTTGYLRGTKHLTQDQIYNIMSEEMAPFFLGPMPPRDFISTFLPSSRPSLFQPGMFDALANSHTEVPMYKIFVSNCIHLSALFGTEDKSSD